MSSTDQPHCPDLEKGHVIPAFTLPGADGMPHSPWDYKQREHLLLIFLANSHSTDSRNLLRAFAGQYPLFRTEQCAIMAITANPVIANLQTQEELRLPYPLLADAQSAVISRYTRIDTTTQTIWPTIILADRYGALYDRWIEAQEGDLPPLTDLLETLRYMNFQCSL